MRAAADRSVARLDPAAACFEQPETARVTAAARPGSQNDKSHFIGFLRSYTKTASSVSYDFVGCGSLMLSFDQSDV